MLRRAFLPTMNKFEADSPYANGNWGAIVNRFRMAAALAMGDTVMYRAAIEHFLHANDNSALPNYVGQTGQCQETGRDQAHAQLGLGALCDICEMAWQQGDDLWGALDNRLMKGIEYTARYNLGYDVPFETWTDCTGLYNDWTEPGAMARGRIQNIYDQPYNHYVGRRGLKMPYTKKLLALQRKAERQNKVKTGLESNEFTVPGVTGSLPNGEGGGRGPLHQVFTYPAPEGAPLKHDYDVYVCPRGSQEWTKIDTYMAKVNVRPLSNSPRGGEDRPLSNSPRGGEDFKSSGDDSSGNAALPPTGGAGRGASGGAGRGARHKISEISYCFFDFTGDVFVRVVTKNKKFKSARIRPDYRGTIANVQNDSTVQFLLFQPENVSVEFDGNITDNLLVFTSKPPVSKEEAEAQAKKEGRQFIYIPAGFYEIKDKRLEIKDSQAQPSLVSRLSSLISDGNILVPSNTTLYLAPGAYFTSTFAIEDTRNVSILGRGIARPPRGYEGAHVHRSQNVLIDGLVVNTCPIGAARNVTLHDVRSISHPGWGDGLNVFGGSSDILFDRVFCRNSDDCTTAYATRKDFSGSTRNIHMRNSTLWADVAHPIFIGLHGAAAGPHPERRDTIENLLYENIDILCQAEAQVDYQGCMAINCGDNNLVRNVTFDNIRIENIHQGSLLHVKVGWNQKYCKAPGLGVENITFRTIRYYGEQPILSLIYGYDADHRVSGVHFKDFRLNGHRIYDAMPEKPKWYKTADFAGFFVGEHVDDITFE